MTKDDIKNFFEQYVKSYAPFKESNLFRGLMNGLVNYYYDELYNLTPEEFKKMYDDQEVPEEIYDNLLVAIGVPYSIILQMNSSEKVIMLSSLADFQRYKGSVKFAESLSAFSTDKIGIYELYTDFDSTLNDWVLRPVEIYKHPLLDQTVDPILYDVAYASVSSLLISKETLQDLKDSEDIILPYKSNLLLLDFNRLTNASLLTSLIDAVLIKEVKLNEMNVYFKDTSYSMRFKDVYFLWYWLATIYYDAVWPALPLLKVIKFFQDTNNPYNVTNLDTIVSDYENIDTRSELITFLDSVISPLSILSSSPLEYHKEDLEVLFGSLNSDVKDYILQRLDAVGTDEEDIKNEIIDIFDELYNAFLLFFLTYSGTNPIDVKKYSSYFLDMLPQFTGEIEKTISYVLLYNMKPYHTELVTKISRGILADSIEEALLLDDNNHFEFLYKDFSVSDVYDDSVVNFLTSRQSSYQILDWLESNFEHTKEETITQDDSESFEFDKSEDVSVLSISDQFTIDVTPVTAWPPWPPTGGILP